MLFEKKKEKKKKKKTKKKRNKTKRNVFLTSINSYFSFVQNSLHLSYEHIINFISVYLRSKLFFVFSLDNDNLQAHICFIGILEEFKRQFDIQKNMPALKKEAPPWTFNPSAVFGRFNAFLKRLSDIEWLFHTVTEFSKLEKIEIGGVMGRSLSSRIVAVYKEFQQLFTAFSTRATDVLEPDDESFVQDCKKFNNSIIDLDSKLAAILCQAFDDCGNFESAFKVHKAFDHYLTIVLILSLLLFLFLILIQFKVYRKNCRRRNNS
jgi:hypothetical protein